VNGYILRLRKRVCVARIRRRNRVSYLEKRHEEHAESEAKEQADQACDENVIHARFLPSGRGKLARDIKNMIPEKS
jgi:hypothetical protein